MKVSELIEALKKCDPNRRVIINSGYGGIVEITTVYQKDQPNLGSRMSFQYVHVVEICQASPGLLLEKGLDVKADIPCHFDREFDYEVLPSN
jgi:hypothetical protein